MYAIEFETDVHNNTIQIPIEYKELEAKHIKVFIVEVKPTAKLLPAGFLNPVLISNYKNILYIIECKTKRYSANDQARAQIRSISWIP